MKIHIELVSISVRKTPPHKKYRNVQNILWICLPSATFSFVDIAMDWSDHAMWWPEKNIWLDNTRWTLDQYNITADAFLQFTPMHKTLRIQLPDLRYIDCSVDFSVRTFNAMLNLCSELEIRHPEELSLCKPLEIEHLKYNYSQVKRAEEKRRRVTLGAMPNHRSATSASSQHLDQMIVVDRPDTNTFIANRYCIVSLLDNAPNYLVGYVIQKI